VDDDPFRVGARPGSHNPTAMAIGPARGATCRAARELWRRDVLNELTNYPRPP